MAELDGGPLSTENLFEHVPGMPGEAAVDAGDGAATEPAGPALFGSAEEGTDDPIPVFEGMNVENMASTREGATTVWCGSSRRQLPMVSSVCLCEPLAQGRS